MSVSFSKKLSSREKTRRVNLFNWKQFGVVYLALVNRTRTSNAEEAEVERFYEDLQDLLELTCKKGAFFLFIIGDWNAKVGSQETPGATGKFGLGVQNEAGQRRIEQTPSSNNTREDSTHGHHQMVNTEIKLIIFFAAKEGEALSSQQKQDEELTVAQITNALLPNSDLN